MKRGELKKGFNKIVSVGGDMLRVGVDVLNVVLNPITPIILVYHGVKLAIETIDDMLPEEIIIMEDTTLLTGESAGDDFDSITN